MFAAPAMSLLLIGMSPDMAGVIDRSTVKVQGGEASADLITITGDPNGGEGLGRIAVSHMRFDCKGTRMALTGGFSQPQTGNELKPVETHDWSPVPPQSPAWAIFQFACFNQTPQPSKSFTSFDELLRFYDDALKGPPAKP